MTFTKVTNTGIGSTGTVLLQNLDVIGVTTVGGGVSAGINMTAGQIVRLWHNGSRIASTPRNFFSGYLVGQSEQIVTK